MSTCGTNLKAVDHANIRNSKGLRSTGVGVVVCARHTFIRPNGARDLQKGERYVNMDYILLGALSGSTVNRLCIVYDIVCQWHKKFADRMLMFPEDMRFDLANKRIEFAVPKGHLNGHGDACKANFSLNFLPGSGRTDGEGVERDWATMNALVASTQEMMPGNRHETIEDHWNYWNWQKVLRLGTFSSLRSLNFLLSSQDHFWSKN